MEIEAQLSKPGAWDKPEELTPVLREKSAVEFRLGMLQPGKRGLEIGYDFVHPARNKHTDRCDVLLRSHNHLARVKQCGSKFPMR